MTETQQFLEALFGGKPERAAIQIWIRSSSPRTWFCDDIAGAAVIARESSKGHDVYVACGMAAEAHEKPLRTRLKAGEVVGVPGVWADIDINGGPDSKAGAAPSREAAIALANDVLEPTVLVASGYGIQAWWLWEDGPWMFPTRAEQEQAKRIVTGMQGALRAAARRAGFTIDATQDLSRVMRIPGTLNHKDKKNPAPVELLACDGKRYSSHEIASVGQGYSLPREDAPEGDEIAVNIRLQRPDVRVYELMANEPEFKAVWDRRRGIGSTRRTWTPSEYEMSIANWLARAGLEPQQIADALVVWRNIHEPGDPRGKLRPERLAITISKAMKSIAKDEDDDFIEAVREEAIQTLSTLAKEDGEPNEAKGLAALNQIIGGPEIARIKQITRDVQRARIAIELADGREVPLGPVRNLLNQGTFRELYFALTQHYPPTVKASKWEKIIAGLGRVIQVVDEVEDTSVGEMRGIIIDYVEGAGSGDRNGAIQGKAPFCEEGHVYLSMDHFGRYLRRINGDRTDTTDVRMLLRVLGFERRVVGFTKPDGVRSTRSYFRGLMSLDAAA